MAFFLQDHIFNVHRWLHQQIRIDTKNGTLLKQQKLHPLNTSNVMSEIEEKATLATLPALCPAIPPGLKGKIIINNTVVPTMENLEERFNWVKPGGYYEPKDCDARNFVAIIVPYRSRRRNLLLFLQHIHPFLKKQQIKYRIFVVEQDEHLTFNKGMLMNIGFEEAVKMHNFQCVIFHDVDLLPEDDRNLYVCPDHPKHMSVAINIYEYKLRYPELFGGVTAYSIEHFIKLNGYSNCFWGWGGEDDDMYYRLISHDLKILRHPPELARYIALPHDEMKENPRRYNLLKKSKRRMKGDGLTSLDYYRIVKYEHKRLYTWILVNIIKIKC